MRWRCTSSRDAALSFIPPSRPFHRIDTMIRWPAAGDAVLHGEFLDDGGHAGKAIRHVTPVPRFSLRQRESRCP